MRKASHLALLCSVGLGLAACTPPEPGETQAKAYLGIETRKLDAELVSFLVRMRAPESASDLDEYALCAAAQYALIRGFGFARHLRTNIAQEGGIWTADAVYTISAALPPGIKTIDAEVTVENCTEQGIPTV